MEQEAESEWKVSGVGQMLLEWTVEWTVDRMRSSPFMVLLRVNSSPDHLRSIRGIGKTAAMICSKK